MSKATKKSIPEKYKELLLEAKKRNEMCGTGRIEENYQGVLDLMFDNTKIDKVLEEIFPNDELSCDDLTEMTVESSLAYFTSVSVALSTDSTQLNLVASQVFAQKLIEVITHERDISSINQHLLDGDVKVKVLLLLDLLKKLLATNNFDKLSFVKCLSQQVVPMELIWLLHKEYLVTFRSYFLSWYDDASCVDQFCFSVRSLCCDETTCTAELRLEIVQVLISGLLQISYGENEENEMLVKKTNEILFKIIEYIDKENDAPLGKYKKWLSLYQVIRGLTDIPFVSIHTFFHEAFNGLLRRPCNVTDDEAISSQAKWSYEFLSEAIITTYQQFILVFRTEEIIQIFERAIDTAKSEAVNIQVLSHFLIVFLISSEDSFTLFEAFLSRCISEAFENCDVRQLRLLFLLRRQAALEGNHISPSYSAWFQKTFVGSNGLALGLNTKRTVQFFYKFLSDLVPFENPGYLKVHIFKSHVPSKFKYFVDDYISLAKTRLADLNENLEDSGGIFDKNRDSMNDEQAQVVEQANNDVKKALKLYEDSGRVPTTIMEASIFRKPYFIGRFLPALLLPRKPPVEADLRARLIEDLKRAGKIPSSMLRSYRKKCDNFGVSSSNVQTTCDNVQVVLSSLEKLPTLILDTINGTGKTKGFEPWLSSISRKLELIFEYNENASETINLDLASIHVTRDQMQVSYAIVNVFCRTSLAVENASTSESFAENRATNMCWASKIISMLFSFPKLIEGLYIRLWSTVCLQPVLLSQQHIHGFVALVCQLSSTKYGQSSSIAVRSAMKLPELEHYQSIADLLINQIPLSSRSSLQFFTRWCCSYVQYALVGFKTLTIDNTNLVKGDAAYVPKMMITKMRYLLNKLNFKKTDGVGYSIEKTLNLLKVITPYLDGICDSKALDQCQLRFSQWLVWELNNDDDILLEHERQSYYNWAVYEHFISNCGTGNSSHTNYCEVASRILTALMNHYIRL